MAMISATSAAFFSAHPSRIARMVLAGLAAAVLLHASPGTAQAQASNGYSVDINGAGQLGSVLKDYLDIMRHRKDANVSQAELERLVAATPEQIRQLLATEGYFSPRIESQLVQEGERRIARFNVVPGIPTRVAAVELRFKGAITQGPAADPARIERLRREWTLQRGDIYKQNAWDTAKAELLKGLLVRDFPAAQIVSSAARIEPQQQQATLIVEVNSGPQFTFGELQIQGLSRYPRERVTALSPITPGEPYSQEKLTELQTRLQDSGYFNTAFATVEIDPAQPRNVPVRIDLNENKRHKLSAGVGFSTDAGAHVQGKWLDRHFMGRDWRLESELRLDQKTRLLGFDLYFPQRANGWRPSVGAFLARTDIENEVNDRVRLDARITNLIRANEKTWGVAYIAERQRIADIESNNRQALVGTFAYTRRRIDNMLKPTRGYVAGIELAAGPRGVVNEDNIGRVVVRGNWLSPKFGKVQAVLRGEVGQLVGAERQQVPSDLLFRTGGDRSVRGYGYNTLGVPVGDAIVGGRVMAVASAELIYYFLPAWGVAVFHDAGNAADAWRDFDVKQGTGIGARWSSPIGPVSVDVAVAHDTKKPRLHFSIGYGF